MNSTVGKQSAEQQRLTICICTFRRPKGLRRLLRSIHAQVLPTECPVVSVAVVENEENGPGQAVCEQLADDFQFPLNYSVEPRRGIAAARNAAVRQATDTVDFLVFIDDDATADPNWLAELLRVQTSFDADIVPGAVLPRFETEPPSWIESGRFFSFRSHATGTTARPRGTCNVLLRREVLGYSETPFDSRFALTGGEDAHLFHRVVQQGWKSVWANEAVVTEWIPATRISARYLLSQSFQFGMNRAYILRDLEPAFRAIFKTLLEMGRHGLLVMVYLLQGIVRGRQSLIHALQHFLCLFGMIGGSLGLRRDSYQRIHGD